MHELPVTEGILKIVLKHAAANNVREVKTIRLQIGKLSDLEDEWIQRYFDYLSKDTVAEGAILKIERMPVVVQCRGCAASYETEVADMGNLACPVCGKTSATLLSGKEYIVKEMDVL